MEALCLASSSNDKGGCFKACLLTWIVVLVVFVFATAGFVLGPMCIEDKDSDGKCKMELLEITMPTGWAGFITAISIVFWICVLTCCAWRWIKVCARWKEVKNPLRTARVNKETAELQLEAEKLRHERAQRPSSPNRSPSPRSHRHHHGSPPRSPRHRRHSSNRASASNYEQHPIPMGQDMGAQTPWDQPPTYDMMEKETQYSRDNTLDIKVQQSYSEKETQYTLENKRHEQETQYTLEKRQEQGTQYTLENKKVRKRKDRADPHRYPEHPPPSPRHAPRIDHRPDARAHPRGEPRGHSRRPGKESRPVREPVRPQHRPRAPRNKPAASPGGGGGGIGSLFIPPARPANALRF